MTDLVVGRRYSRALFLISRERGVVGEVTAELRELGRLLEDPAIARVLTSPATTAAARRTAVAAIATQLGLSRLTGDFLGLLAERRRLSALPAISLLFEAMVDREAGRVRARIRSAVPLAQAALDEVAGILQRKTGKEVVARVEVAPDLLGGIVVHAGGRVYDASVRRQLEKLGEAMAAA